MPRRLLPAAITALLWAGAACAPGASTDPGRPTVAAPDWTPAQIRQPALSVRVTLQGEWTERERTTWPRDYEGLLLEGFNARAVVVRDVQGGADKALDRRQALTRAREVGADHAILVEARVARETVVVCRETGRPRRGEAVVWRQNVEVLRVADGASRLEARDSPVLTVTDADVDCETGRARRQEPDRVMRSAVEKLLSRLLGP